VTPRTLCLPLLVALGSLSFGCSSHAERVVVRSPEPTSAAFSVNVEAPPTTRAELFTSNGSGVRRIDAALP
jgi:hypothetical protein